MKTCSIFQEESYSSILSISYALNRSSMKESYSKFLLLSHKFGVLLHELYVSELRKVLPHMGCAACGRNEQVFLAVDGCFKLSRALKTSNDTRRPLSTFFLAKEKTLYAKRNQSSSGEKECSSSFNAIKSKAGIRGKRFDEKGTAWCPTDFWGHVRRGTVLNC